MTTAKTILKSPFPYFGGKSKVAEIVWSRFGRVDNYVEPFFGSGAMLLARPDDPSTETVNDKDGLLANFWRALQREPNTVAEFADWPVNENDLHARHAWLVSQKDSLQAKLEGNPDFYDCKIAGWWVWGMACWIGSGFCSGRGPWRVEEIDGVRQLVHLGDEGQGVNRQRDGTIRKRPMICSPAMGKMLPVNSALHEYFNALAARLRNVRVCCGDWSRVCGPSVTFKHGLTAVFLDPPYADTAKRAKDLYRVDCERIAHDVRGWAIENGTNPLMRIALCGYDGEHTMPADWECFAWNAGEGFGGQADERTKNGRKERIWFSPHCVKDSQPDFFA